MPDSTLYDGHDPRDLPAYGIAEAARYLHLPSATLRSWVLGRTYPRGDGVASFDPVLRAADPAGRLSFNNLIEAHVLRALRTDHGVRMKDVRPALTYAERELGIQQLLLSEALATAAGELFLERFGELINLSRSGQLYLKKMLEAHLRRVERDAGALPIRLYPFLTAREGASSRSVVIDPRVAFGRPTLAGYGVRTDVVAERIDAGETVAELAEDYDIPTEVLEEALIFQNAA